MKRVNILWLMLDSLFLIVFNVLFFMFIYTENIQDSVWVSYGFIHFAYILLLTTPLLVRRGKADYIYRRPLYAITTTYFLIELVAGTVLILKMPDNFILTIVLQVILAAIFLAWLLSHLIANEHTAKNVEKREIELQYVKESASRIQSILRQITDKTANKKVKMLYDLIHSSSVKSHYNVYPIEQDIINEIGALSSAAMQNEPTRIIAIADKIYNLAEERNRQLKLLNR